MIVAAQRPDLVRSFGDDDAVIAFRQSNDVCLWQIQIRDARERACLKSSTQIATGFPQREARDLRVLDEVERRDRQRAIRHFHLTDQVESRIQACFRIDIHGKRDQRVFDGNLEHPFSFTVGTAPDFGEVQFQIIDTVFHLDLVVEAELVPELRLIQGVVLGPGDLGAGAEGVALTKGIGLVGHTVRGRELLAARIHRENKAIRLLGDFVYLLGDFVRLLGAFIHLLGDFDGQFPIIGRLEVQGERVVGVPTAIFLVGKPELQHAIDAHALGADVQGELVEDSVAVEDVVPVVVPGTGVVVDHKRIGVATDGHGVDMPAGPPFAIGIQQPVIVEQKVQLTSHRVICCLRQRRDVIYIKHEYRTGSWRCLSGRLPFGLGEERARDRGGAGDAVGVIDKGHDVSRCRGLRGLHCSLQFSLRAAAPLAPLMRSIMHLGKPVRRILLEL